MHLAECGHCGIEIECHEEEHESSDHICLACESPMIAAVRKPLDSVEWSFLDMKGW